MLFDKFNRGSKHPLAVATVLALAGVAAPAFAGQAGERIVVDSYIDNSRKYRNMLGQSGRPSVCIPTGSRLQGQPC